MRPTFYIDGDTMSEHESSQPQHDENHIMAERRDKLKALREGAWKLSEFTSFA